MRAILSFFVAAAATWVAATAVARDPGPMGAGPADADTQQWWALTRELSGDAMEGRDTGSPAYDRAAALVARRFAEAGLKPVGENGGWFQPIAFDDLRVDEAHSAIVLHGTKLAPNREVLVSPTLDTPLHVDAPATYRGYCGPAEIGDVTGKLVVCYGRPAPARLNGFDRAKALQAAGAVGMLLLSAPGLASEPIRWPFAYSRSVAIAGTHGATGQPFLTGILNPGARIWDEDVPLLEQLGAHTQAGMVQPFDLGRFKADLAITRTATRSANVLGLLPGTDPKLADQVVIVAAHLDGYGHGEPVDGDGIYNGALDDAAYVALLERLAAVRAGRGFARPVLFAVFTGEEKGLLGSTWFAGHPTVPFQSIAAIINLDQIRPLYPLKLMTVHGLHESNLGDVVRQVAGAQGIAVQEDPEPERNLLRRSDNWPLMQKGVPGLSFVLATDDAAAKAAYNDWYMHRYHHPADDLSTPIDWQAARDFNAFFYVVTQRAADLPEPIALKTGGKP
jgi:hypothetical protein